MSETLRFDPKTYDWMHSHRWADITVVKCEKCGLHYKPDLGHVCDKTPKLEFSRKIGNIELCACPHSLARLRDDDPNTTINIKMWQKDSNGKPYTFSIAYWKRDKEGYYLHFVGARPFLYVDESRVPELWEAMQEAQKVLDAWFDDSEAMNDA